LKQRYATIGEIVESNITRNTNLKIKTPGGDMKHTRTNLLAVLLLILTTSLLAGPNSADRDVIEENYLAGISSENYGLKVSSTFFLGEMKSSKAVIPLMRILREGDCEGVRLAAALALIKIGDARGVYIVKKAVDFNDCEKVRKLAKHLYAAYISGEMDMAEIAENDVNFALAALK